MFAKNLSRVEAFREVPFENSCFINIQEPTCLGYDSFHTDPLQCSLSNLNTLVVSFSDVANVQVAHMISKNGGFEEILVPLASNDDIKNIYNFIIENKGKNFYVNCMAGVSRSGAIVTFLKDFFGYSLVEPNSNRISVNSYIYNKLMYLHFDKLTEDWNSRNKK